MKKSRLAEIAALSLLCVGCASASLHYYTLSRPIPADQEPAVAHCCQVEIRPVSVPPEVDRPELVTRRGAVQAALLVNDTWLAPLRDEIRGALSTEINRKFSQSRLAAPNPTDPAYVVSVNIGRFDSVFAQYVVVTADWRVHRTASPKAVLALGQWTARVAIGNGISPMVQGYQEALAQIADRIVSDLHD